MDPWCVFICMQLCLCSIKKKKHFFFLIPGNCFSSKIQHFHFFFSPHLWIILTDSSAYSLGREAVIGIGSVTDRKGRAPPELSGDESDAGRGFPLWFVFCVRVWGFNNSYSSLGRTVLCCSFAWIFRSLWQAV